MSNNSKHNLNTNNFMHRPSHIKPKVLKNDSKMSFKLMEDTLNTNMNKTEDSFMPTRALPKTKMPQKIMNLNYATDTQQSDINEDVPKGIDQRIKNISGALYNFKKKGKKALTVVKSEKKKPEEKLATFGVENSTNRSQSNERFAKISSSRREQYSFIENPSTSEHNLKETNCLPATPSSPKKSMRPPKPDHKSPKYLEISSVNQVNQESFNDSQKGFPAENNEISEEKIMALLEEERKKLMDSVEKSYQAKISEILRANIELRMKLEQVEKEKNQMNDIIKTSRESKMQRSASQKASILQEKLSFSLQNYEEGSLQKNITQYRIENAKLREELANSFMFTDDIKEQDEKVEKLLEQLSNISMERSKLNQTLTETNLRATTEKFIKKVCSLKGVTKKSSALIQKQLANDVESSLSRSGTDCSKVIGGNPIRRFVLKHNSSYDELDYIPNEDINVIEMNSSREKHSATFTNLNTLSNHSTSSSSSKCEAPKPSRKENKVKSASNFLNDADAVNPEKQSFYVYKGKLETFEKLLDITKDMGIGKHSEGLIQIIGALANNILLEKSKVLDANLDFNQTEKDAWSKKIESAIKKTQVLTQKQETQKSKIKKDHRDEACCFC